MGAKNKQNSGVIKYVANFNVANLSLHEIKCHFCKLFGLREKPAIQYVFIASRVHHYGGKV